MGVRVYMYIPARSVASVVSDSLQLYGQAPLSMRFSRQGYWSGLPCPHPGDLLDPKIRLTSPAIAGGLFTICVTREAGVCVYIYIYIYIYIYVPTNTYMSHVKNSDAGKD